MAVSPWAAIRNSTIDPPPPDPGPWVPMPETPLPTEGMTVRPQVTEDPIAQNIEQDQKELQKVRWNQAHPWGTAENHPGKLGKVAHIFSQIGNIAGNIVAPDQMRNIEGSQLGMKTKEEGLTNRLDKELQQSSTEQAQQATTEHTRAGVPLEEAQTREANARANDLENPSAKPQDYDFQKIQDPAKPGQTIWAAVNKHNPSDVHPIPSMVVADAAAGGKMESKPGIWNGKNSFGNYNPTTGQYTNADTGEVMHGFQPFPPFSQVPNIQPYPIFNPQTQSLGVGGFNTKSGNLSIPKEGAAFAVPSNVMGDLNKNLEDARSADTRFRVMTDAVPAALHGDQQAMVNILTNHVGMTLGLQRGARITQAIYGEAEQSAPWLARVQAHFDPNTGYLTGAVLTPEQIHQMVGLGQDRRMRQWQQASDAANTFGIPLKMPHDLEHPSTVLNTPGSQTFTVNGQKYNIPSDKVAEFKKDHPDAR